LNFCEIFVRVKCWNWQWWSVRFRDWSRSKNFHSL